MVCAWLYVEQSSAARSDLFLWTMGPYCLVAGAAVGFAASALFFPKRGPFRIKYYPSDRKVAFRFRNGLFTERLVDHIQHPQR